MIEEMIIQFTGIAIIPIYIAARIYIGKSILRKHMRPILTAFVAGYLFRLGGTVWMQDTLGLELYVKYVQSTWVDISPVVGTVLLVGAVFLLFLAFARFKGLFEVDGKCARKHDL